MIPRTFHRLWVGPPMPAHLEQYGETWKQHHPGWQHILWTEETLPPLRNQRLYDNAEKIAPNNVGQFRADVARYELLLTHGGVWIDADMQCLQPIDDLIAGVDCFAGWETEARWVNNAILGCTPGHPFLDSLVRGLGANVRRKAGARPNILSGPQYLTPVYRRHARQVTVFPQRTFYPYLWNELDRGGDQFPHSHAVHHWNNRRRGVPV